MRTRLSRRWVVVGGVIVLLLGAVALGLLAGVRPDDGTLERVQANGELRVGLDASFPPFESLDSDGNVIGFDPDLADAIAEALGAEPVFVNVGFDGLYDALWAGRVDVVISGLPYDPRRTQDVNYSQPYFNAGQVLVVRVDDKDFMRSDAESPAPVGSTSDRSAGIPILTLSGRVIAVEWGSLADMEARRLKESAEDLETLPQPTAEDALNALVAGQADAAIADAISAYQFTGERGKEVRVAAVLTEEPYVIATRVKSRHLAQAIDDTLTDLRGSGALHELMDNWF